MPEENRSDVFLEVEQPRVPRPPKPPTDLNLDQRRDLYDASLETPSLKAVIAVQRPEASEEEVDQVESETEAEEPPAAVNDSQLLLPLTKVAERQPVTKKSYDWASEKRNW